MKKYKNKLWDIFFAKSTDEQIKFVQVQIDTFRDYVTPVYNLKIMQFQLRIALIVNIYLSYLLIIERYNLKEYFFESIIGTTWFILICVQNILILFPKIIMMTMLQIVVNYTRSIDELIINIEQFMQTKIYYYNCYFSKFIWINYGVGTAYWALNQAIGYQESAEKIVSLCHHVLYLMIARFLIFIIKVQIQSTGLSKKQLEILISSKQLVVNDKFISKNEDICSICLEDYEEGDNVIKLDCKHYYHMKCIKPWLIQQNKCPCCNQFAFREL